MAKKLILGVIGSAVTGWVVREARRRGVSNEVAGIAGALAATAVCSYVARAL